MRKLLFLLPVLLLATLALAHAQISIPNVFTNGTVADANQVNANFTALGNAALNRGGGSMVGDLLFSDGLYDIGKSGATRPRDGFFSRNLTVGGVLAVNGGPTTHAFTASGVGVQALRVRNSAAGGTNQTQLVIGNDSFQTLAGMSGFSSTYATALYNIPNGAVVYSNGAGGLSLATTTNAPLRFYANDTEIARITASGVSVGSANVTDSIGTPTANGVCGTNAPTVVGKDFAFVVTLPGTPGTLSGCGFTFGGTYANAPACVASQTSGMPSSLPSFQVATTTTTVSLTSNTTSATNSTIAVLCRGF